MKTMYIKGSRFTVRHLKVYDALSRRGYRPAIVASDKNDPRRLVWMYDISDKLLADLGEISKEVYGADTVYVRAD